MRTYQWIITCQAPDYQPSTMLHGEIADRITRVWLEGVRVTRLQITDIDEPVGEMIDAALCDCVARPQC